MRAINRASSDPTPMKPRTNRWQRRRGACGGKGASRENATRITQGVGLRAMDPCHSRRAACVQRCALPGDNYPGRSASITLAAPERVAV